jgi:hypothetical protein
MMTSFETLAVIGLVWVTTLFAHRAYPAKDT